MISFATVYDENTQLASLKLQLEGLIADVPSDNALIAELDNALMAINAKRRYVATSEAPLEPKYFNLQVRLAKYAVLKSGAEGETSHIENGITRHYDSSSYPHDMMKEVVPLAKTVIDNNTPSE